VTHLPQIACFADVHHRVTKTTSKQRTVTETKELGRADRVEEIARMLGGMEITEKTRAHALEMIDRMGGQFGRR
jgi:DNA repair protein RecN (Recombination protein N)